jgi:hypothetical protein
MFHHLTINKIKSASSLITILVILLFNCLPLSASEQISFTHNSISENRLFTSEKKHNNSDFKEYRIPQTSDSVAPSKELQEIINKVKNESVPSASKYKKKTDRSAAISNFAYKIIKNQKNATLADEVKPSQALQAIFRAYHNGSLTYNQQTDDKNPTFYHPIYSDISFDSIYDLAVLKTGKDIFLSLGNDHLYDSKPNKDSERSQRIKELQQIIFAIKKRDEKKEEVITAEQKEMTRLKISEKGKLSRNKIFAEQLLGFLGITRKKETESYEEMARSYRTYKNWTERWKKYEQMIERKKARSYRLAPLKPFQLNDSITEYKYGNKNSIGTKQLKISP